ncbi:MAG: amidohydrolase family protein, partial [Rhodospirillaceae bacterium]|nr:amidohydrolase family protein [Rhodospirillaceae bacterium]
NGLTGADIRAKLDHPVVDADGHMIESTFAVLDFVRQVGGADAAGRYEDMLKGDQSGPGRRAVWVGNSGPGSIDRATAMLPKLYRARLDEAGIDFGVVYGTLALSVLRVDDDELRPIVYRAMNMLYADMFKEVSDRLTPAALIPMTKPDEAVAELEFAVNELGLKAIVMNTMLYSPPEQIAKEAPHLSHLAMVMHTPALDQGDAYDPVWAKCVELGVAPSCHNAFRGPGTTHNSSKNYCFNSLNSFGHGSEYFCRALFFGGVPERFPDLKFCFLEGGAGWGAQLYNSLFEYWEKRNLDALSRDLDPAKLDVDLIIEMFEKYGDDRLTAARVREDPHQPANSQLFCAPEELDDFAGTGIQGGKDIQRIFEKNFYFGSEADDRMTAVAFDTKLNHYGAKLNAILGSDIGHWDVPDMTKVMVEAYEMLDDGFVTEADFRDFTYANVVGMHAGMNPDFFKGTVVEQDVEKLKAEGL